MLREIGKELVVVFVLQLPEPVASSGCSKRAELEGRVDDTPEAIAKRLELYRRETEPLDRVVPRRARTSSPSTRTAPSNEVFAEIQEALEQAAVA